MKVMLEMKCFIDSTHKMFKNIVGQMFYKHSVKNVFKPIFSDINMFICNFFLTFIVKRLINGMHKTF